MHKNPFTDVIRFIALAGTLAVVGAQADGRIEINQASVEAAGGFPYTITEPGSYVLTGPLTVPAETSGLVIATSYVTIDLNGFSITGPASCGPGKCPSGAASGIFPESFLTDATRSTVRNGTVRGFSFYCVLLTSNALIEGLMVSECGLGGISVGSGVVTGNRVTDTGQIGIGMGAKTTFAHNFVENAGLAVGDHRAVEGGRASAGNSCDDHSCSPRGERRFYLTQDVHDGSAALTACASGFHMASLWEILDVTQLRYDVDNGETSQDSGFGPPSGITGWIRTGKVAFVTSGSPGGQSCNGYTTTDNNGTAVTLAQNWESGYFSTEDSRAPWWLGSLQVCAASIRVWCVED